MGKEIVDGGAFGCVFKPKQGIFELKRTHTDFYMPVSIIGMFSPFEGVEKRHFMGI